MSRSTKEGARARRSRTRAVITTAAACVAAAAFATPAQAAVTTPGASIEVFHGRDFIGLGGYPLGQPLLVEVLAPDGTALAFANVTPERDARGGGTLVEINHVGGDDCFNGGTAPDIIPGDTVRVTGSGISDTSVVQDVQFNDVEQPKVDPVPDDPTTVEDETVVGSPRKLIITGWARQAGTELALDNLSVRVRGAFDTSIERGSDVNRPERQEFLPTLAADGSFRQDVLLGDDESYDEISGEWGNAALSELTIFDGIATTCPRGPGGDRPIVSPPPFVPPAPPAAPPTRTPIAPRIVTNTIIQTVPGAGAAAAPSQSVLPSTVQSLRVSRLSLARRISITRLRTQGLRASMTLPQGTSVVRIAVYKARNGKKTGRALFVSRRAPRSAGLYRVTLRNRNLLRRIRSGSYVLEVQAGQSAASLGRASGIAFRVTR